MERGVGRKMAFLKELELIQGRLSPEELKRFNALGSNSQRIETVLKINGLYDSIRVEPFLHSKTPEEAERFKNEGNRYFKQKKYVQAQESYTKCIFAAPMDGDMSKHLALGHANRSAALFYIEKYDDCVIDIGKAMEQKYPQDSIYKLYDRRAKCYLKLHNAGKALEDFKKALDSIEQTPTLDEIRKRQWVSDIQNSITRSTHYKNGKITTSDSRNGNKKLKFEVTSTEQCEALGIGYDPDRGRHTLAKKNMGLGEVALQERPYAAVLYNSCNYTHCHHCFQRCLTLLPSLHCADVGFCNDICRDKAKAYHEIECRYLDLLSEKGLDRLGHLALRIILTAKLDEVLMVESPEDSTNDSDGLTPCPLDNSFHNIMKLVANSSKRTQNNLLQFTLMALYPLKILDQTTLSVKNGFDTSACFRRLVRLGACVLHLIQVIQCNGISVSEMQTDSEFAKSKPRDIGLGIYATCSLLNHSCNPDVDFNFVGNACVVRVVKPISIGQEVMCDYGPVYYITEKSERQEHLLQQYLFQCECEACVGDWPLADSLPSSKPVFRCSKCGNALECSSGENLSAQPCGHCGRYNNVLQLLQKLCKSHEAYTEAVKKILTGDFKTAAVLERHLALMHESLALPWKEFVNCQATIKQYYRLQGNSNRPC